MRASYTNPSTADLVDGALAVAAGIGVVTLALFPLAIPILALTVVALIPLLAPLLLIALVGGMIAAPFLLRAPARRRPDSITKAMSFEARPGL